MFFESREVCAAQSAARVGHDGPLCVVAPDTWLE